MVNTSKQAYSSNALAPNPYTVSVGKATILPYLILSAAFLILILVLL